MGGLNDIVDVTISRDSDTVSQVGFGVPLILGIHTKFAEDFKVYSDLTEMLDDFTTSDAEYQLASDLFAQNPRPSSVMVGKRAANVAQVSNIDVSVVTDSVDYVVTINGNEYTYNSGVGASAGSIVDGLILAITGNEPVSLTDNGDDFNITASVAGTPFTISVDTKMTLTESVANKSVVTELQRIQNLNGGNDWYFLLLTTYTDLDILQAAEYIETQLKFFMAFGYDADIITSATDDIASQLKAFNYDRTAIIFTKVATTNRLDAAWIGKIAPKDPGSVTWKFKNLASVASDTLSTSEITYAKSKNCNVYIERGGIDITEEGITVSGEFIDIIRGTDWIQARLEENIFSVLSSNDKIPYTNGGIDVIRAQVLAVLQNAISQGILSNNPAPVVVVPDILNVSGADKANRELKNVTFTATYQGAIHKVTITGKISV